MNKPSFETVLHYHEQTKHHYHRFAKSAGMMDWENQPNPFRSYAGADIHLLPFLHEDPAAAHEELYRRTARQPVEFSFENIAGFLELSMGLSAWKAYGGSRWPLRMNPSSGNLHPTETHLILPQLGTLPAGVYHYQPFRHALEWRMQVPGTFWQETTDHFGCRGFLIGLTSIFWRESWKYGERAYRYCNLDIGHALAGLSFAGTLWGWRVGYLNGVSDHQIEKLLGLDQTHWPPLEAEHPDLLCFVYPHTQVKIPKNLPKNVLSHLADKTAMGTPNPLSKQRVNWKIIYETAEKLRKPATRPQTFAFGSQPWFDEAPSNLPASEIIRKRRSATDYDRNYIMPLASFLSMLDKTLPRDGNPPFDTECGETAIHLLLFVHRVAELSSGLYFMFRNHQDSARIKSIVKNDFKWEPVAEGFPLFLLDDGDFRFRAMEVSCNQEIAGFSAFSLGMIARFKATCMEHPYFYRHLFWEAGMVGQALYLEAEAQGIRGTGIGCFFDNPVHDLLGLTGHTFQSLYHFTAGKPLNDPRLTTYPPYVHMQKGSNGKIT